MKTKNLLFLIIFFLLIVSLFRIIGKAGIRFGMVDAVQGKLQKLDKKISSSMVYIPAGEFIMGSSSTDSDENPQHTVYLDAYSIDRFEVTSAQYAEFLNAKGNQTEGGSYWIDLDGTFYAQIEEDNGTYKPKKGYENYPVTYVTWYGARAYAEWAGKRLPTEAEWEKAARGTDGRTYPWGEGIDTNKAQYASEVRYYSDHRTGQGYYYPVYEEPVRIGSFVEGSSSYGCYDAAGNVWEWCNDWYDENYYSVSPANNPKGAVSGTLKVNRGGSYQNTLSSLRCSNRACSNPTMADNAVGFRCAKDAN